ncbi:MAG: hypothetical protein WD648_13020 [Planctomycetaceae bacterium]
MPVTETPFCFAMLFGDVIYKDQGTGKWTVFGVFDMSFVPQLPAEFQLPVFIGLTDGRGKMSMKVQLVPASADFDDSADNLPVGFVDLDANFAEPLDVLQLSVAIPVKVEHAGAYCCELLLNNERVMTRRFLVNGPPEAIP